MLQVKLTKILIGFCTIATQIPRVYEVRLPDDVMKLLESLKVVVTFGMDWAVATPLACIGLDGYTTQLTFWIVAPLVLILLILTCSAAWLAISRFSPSRALLTAAPPSLYLLFLSFLIVTREAFEAFSCHSFDDGSEYLRADVSIVRTDDHYYARQVHRRDCNLRCQRARILRILALYCAACHHLRQVERALQAISFLHREYEPRMYWWEVMEMLRRLLLVGVFVLPRHDGQGSIEQLGYGTVTATLYLAIQTSAAPFKHATDDFFAAGCSLMLALFFVCSIFFKFAELTQLAELQDRMTIEQKDDYLMPYTVFGGILMAACSGVFVLLGVIFAMQAGDQARLR